MTRLTEYPDRKRFDAELVCLKKLVGFFDMPEPLSDDWPRKLDSQEAFDQARATARRLSDFWSAIADKAEYCYEYLEDQTEHYTANQEAADVR